MQARPGNQLAGSEPRAPRTLEECLKALEPLSIARGQLVATDGVCDVRVSVERGQIEVELIGHELPRGLQGDAAIVRALLDTVFWDGPLYDVNAGAPQTLAEDPKKPRPRARVARADAPREICRAIADELVRLEAVRRRVPTLLMTAQATPLSKDAKGGSPIAVKLRGALVAKNGEVALTDWTRAEGLSLTDTATAFAELLDANEAKVARKLDAVASTLRMETALKGGGFCPGLRLERGARALAAKDAVRATAAFVRAGHERLANGRILEALDAFHSACATDPKTLPDQGIAAMEGLLLALEADAKDQRRPEPRSPQELKRVAVDLGRAYFQLGLMNRARSALERGLDDAAPLASQLELIDALAGAGQLGKALDRAEALAPKLDRSSRRELARKLAEGAKGPSLERALGLAGVRGERRTAGMALVVTVFALVVAGGFGAQAAAATSLAAATKDARERIAKEGPTPELAASVQSIADRFVVVPAARKARETAARIADLAADAKWLRTHQADLAWRSSTDPDAARGKIKAVLEGARTDELRARVSEVLAALEKSAQQCRNEVDLVRSAIDSNEYVVALDNARRVVEHFPRWKDQWKELRVPIRIKIERPENAIVEWDGERVTTQAATIFVVYLALVPGNALLNARGEPGSGWKSDIRKVELETTTSTITIALEREVGAPPIVDRRPVNAGNTGTGTGDLPPSGTKTGGDTARADPRTGKGKISIGGATGPDPATPDKTDDPDKPQPEKRGKFEVREVSGADIQKLLGGTPVDVTPSAGYFDFLASELPRDGRLRLSIDVITVVRDKKLYLEGVKLRLQDTVLGHYVEPREVKPDDESERPVQGQANGRRAVLALDRTVGIDQAKFKAAVRDELVGMVRKFNKDEGQ